MKEYLTKKSLVSACKTFCNENIELIPFAELNIHNENYKNDFREYLNLLSNQGVANAQEKVSKMLLLDLDNELFVFNPANCFHKHD